MMVVGGDAKPYLVSDIVEDNAVWAADEPAIIFKDRTWTWREFRDGVNTLRRGLSRQGIVRGSRVAILERNCDEYILLHYALAGMGAILVPINVWLRVSEIAYILASSQPSMLVVGAEFADTAAAAINALADPPRLLYRRGGTSGHVCWSDLLADGPPVTISTPDSWDDPHIILYTSGTTSRIAAQCSTLWRHRAPTGSGPASASTVTCPCSTRERGTTSNCSSIGAAPWCWRSVSMQKRPSS
jgi:fatty-acyl-CoA synthase